MHKCILTLILLSATPLFSQGQLYTEKKDLSKLCSDLFFGRGYVKSGDSLAARYIGSRFFEMGLKPVKNDTYYQSFVHSVNTFPGKMELIIGNDTMRPGIDFLMDPNASFSNHSWNFMEVNSAQLYDQSFKNRFITTPTHIKESIDGCIIDLRKMNADSLKRAKVDFIPELARYVDVMVITDEKFVYSVGNDPLTFSLIYLQGSVYRKGSPIKTNIDSKYFPKYFSSNVIAMVPAKSQPKKKVFRKEIPAKSIYITAHYDHLGGMGSNTFFPGANDNASGTAMLLSLADFFVKNPTDYNIVFIAFAAEEAGLLGSLYYTQNPWTPIEDIHFLVNLDIMGSGDEGVTVVNGLKHPEQFHQLVTLNEKKSYVNVVKARGEAANSDHYWFSKRGVPSFFIYAMGNNKNYHDVHDKEEFVAWDYFSKMRSLFIDFINLL